MYLGYPIYSLPKRKVRLAIKPSLLSFYSFFRENYTYQDKLTRKMAVHNASHHQTFILAGIGLQAQITRKLPFKCNFMGLFYENYQTRGNWKIENSQPEDLRDLDIFLSFPEDSESVGFTFGFNYRFL